MDKFLGAFSEKTTAQKTIIIILVTAVFLILLAALYFLTTPSSPKTSTQSQSSQIPQVTAYLHSGKGYSIIYPSDWRTEKASASGKESTRFIPSTNENGVYSPSLKVKVAEYSQSEFSKIESDQLLYFKKDLVQFKGISSEKFIGILPPPDFKGSPTKNTYNSSYLFTKNNLIFLIEYVYDGSASNADWETKINSILDTLQFIQ